MDKKSPADKLREYYKSHPNKGKKPEFTKVKYTQKEVIDKLMPYLKKKKP